MTTVERNWVVLLEKNMHCFPESLLADESKRSLELFKQMASLGFLTSGSQEGIVEVDDIPNDRNVFWKLCEKKSTIRTKDEEVLEYWNNVQMTYKEQGGTFSRGVSHTERAYLTLITTSRLAQALDYCINRYTRFLCIHKRGDLKSLSPAYPRVPVTYSLPRSPVDFPGIMDLEDTCFLSTDLDEELGNSALRACEIPREISEDLDILELLDTRHGYCPHEKDGLFSVSLYWMNIVYEQVIDWSLMVSRQERRRAALCEVILRPGIVEIILGYTRMLFFHSNFCSKSMRQSENGWQSTAQDETMSWRCERRTELVCALHQKRKEKKEKQTRYFEFCVSAFCRCLIQYVR